MKISCLRSKGNHTIWLLPTSLTSSTICSPLATVIWIYQVHLHLRTFALTALSVLKVQPLVLHRAGSFLSFGSQLKCHFLSTTFLIINSNGTPTLPQSVSIIWSHFIPLMLSLHEISLFFHLFTSLLSISSY